MRFLPGLLLLAATVAFHGASLSAATKDAPMKKKGAAAKITHPTFGKVERLDPALDNLIAPDAKIEKLAEGFDWSEGPAWMSRGDFLVFSDVPRNTVYKWKEGEGISVFMKPSGYTGSVPRGGEPGSNGLTVDSAGRLVLAEHGDRRIARLEKNGTKTTLTEYYQFMRYNSPNDLVYDRENNLYFTDPPYGLLGNNSDPNKELMFNGVFLLRRTGQVVLLTKEMTFPNGIALSPDNKTLYVANSDPKLAVWKKFDVLPDGTIRNSRTFFDATSMQAGRKGLPDGMRVDKLGNVFATGPDGVLVFSPEGKHLGTINTGEATANCGWGNDGSVLYITADDKLARIQTLTKGKGY